MARDYQSGKNVLPGNVDAEMGVRREQTKAREVSLEKLTAVGELADDKNCRMIGGVEFLEIPIEPPSAPLFDRAAIAAYMDACVVIFVDSGWTQDVLSDGEGTMIPTGVACDGTFAWPLHLEFYVKNYGICLTERFLSHVRVSGYRPGYVIPQRQRELHDIFTSAEMRR